MHLTNTNALPQNNLLAESIDAIDDLFDNVTEFEIKDKVKEKVKVKRNK